MKNRTIRNNLCIVIATALVVLLYNISAHASSQNLEIKSQGKIVFDNATEDTSDDVIFDANDFRVLSERCR